MPLATVEKHGLARTAWFFKGESGYVAEQLTKPQTLGYDLTDSLALLAWICDKIVRWTDKYP